MKLTTLKMALETAKEAFAEMNQNENMVFVKSQGGYALALVETNYRYIHGDEVFNNYIEYYSLGGEFLMAEIITTKDADWGELSDLANWEQMSFLG